MNTQPEPHPEETPPAPQPPAHNVVSLTGRFAAWAGRLNRLLLVALLALAVIVWQWYDARSQIGALQQEVAKRLAEAGTHDLETRRIAAQTQESMREAQVKLALLESRLAESQNQQVALEALYQELSRNRDESTLAEIEQILLIAGQQLQLAGNVKAALIALQAADNRLQRLDQPQLAALRRVIVKDIERLRALPYVDIVGLSARLDSLIAAVDVLPLATEARPPAAGPAPAQQEQSAWARIGREIWQDFRQLVRIQRMEKPEMPLLSPDQAFFLRENLKLRLLGARLALIGRDAAGFKADVGAARDWLERFYDGRDKAVAAARAGLRQIQENDISIELPDISASLDAVRNYKLSRGK